VETKFFSLEKKKKMLGSISPQWSQAVILGINKAVACDNRMVGHTEVAIEQARTWISKLEMLRYENKLAYKTS